MTFIINFISMQLMKIMLHKILKNNVVCLVHTSTIQWIYSKIQFILILHQPSTEEDMASKY